MLAMTLENRPPLQFQASQCIPMDRDTDAAAAADAWLFVPLALFPQVNLT